MSLGLSLLANGVVLGGVASVMAVAFALVYAATRTFHIAQAAVFTTAGYVLFATHALWGLPLAAGVAAGALAGGLFGVLVDRGLYRTLARAGASPLVVMIGSLATVTVVDNVFGMLFTMDPRFMDTGGLKQAALRLGPVSWTWLQLGGLAAGVIGLAGLSLFLGATRAGKAVRAASANPSLASALGFPLGRLHAMVYFASSVLASLAGMYHALDAGALPYRGLEVFLTAAVAVMLGGVGSLTGAAAVAFILGIVQSLAVWVLPSQWTGALVFALFLLLILLRPEGLLARPQAR